MKHRNAIFNILIIFIFIFQFDTTMAQDKRFIGFCGDTGAPGHAFIVFGREDPEQMMTVHDGTWGLYPKNNAAGVLSYFIGEVPGEIRDDFLKRDVDYILIINPSKEKYDNALNIKKDWESRSYELKKNDCLSFLIEVLNLFQDELNIPERSYFENFPAKYVKKLIELN